ncbi:hypothetical protein SGQ83_05955 [Flavobacterium sp. Fl-318]|uniref:Arm DNA-binding domain-containing protein n=1 Tax=Flavobacterium cupriresistens TaxID=2893885 RepID=A0ABU4R8G3_9FLAO|nr:MULTISPECIES: hypothetical protein [unclassified Flavobacterium]MDX6188885.1 hypothetical protein [Flavobacterium sp. Fl-318]UFH44332.1 hypothetical protein LNP23_08950 [Flavobacterium sp. F-323]
MSNIQKRISLHLSEVLKYFDKKKQRVKASQESFKDYNLLIEKKLAEINTIEINYRSSGRTLNMELLINELDSGKTK